MHHPESLIVIVGGIPPEVEVFANQLAGRIETGIQGLPCYRGTLHGHRCVIAEMGMGKVNAATVTTLLLTQLRPRLVICAGGGGGLNPALRWVDTIVVDKAIQHDYGALRPEGMTRWKTFNPIAQSVNPVYFRQCLLYLCVRVQNEITTTSVQSSDVA